MAEYVVDTQVLVRFMEGKRAPSQVIHDILINVDQGNHTIVIAAWQ